MKLVILSSKLDNLSFVAKKYYILACYKIGLLDSYSFLIDSRLSKQYKKCTSYSLHVLNILFYDFEFCITWLE